MKKLMIAAAIVCAAAMSQAATFSWASKAVAYGPTVETLSALVNGTTYPAATKTTANRMVEEAKPANQGIVWTYIMTLNNGGDDDVITGTVNGYASGMIKQTTMNGSDGEVTLASDLVFKPEGPTESDVVDYSIIITGKYTDANDKVWTLTSDEITGTVTFGSQSTLQIKTDAPTKWKATTEAVPEPTSGLLLLLGVAGLALKRKRA